MIFFVTRLILHKDEIHKRPKISSLLSSLAKYEAVQSAPQQPDDAKPKKVSI